MATPHPADTLFRSEQARTALEKYGAVTHLTVRIHAVDQRPLSEPVHPTPLYQLFADGGAAARLLEGLRPHPGADGVPRPGSPREGTADVRLFTAALIAGTLAAAVPAAAPVAPSPAEVATYTGLHAAAQRGDVGTIQRLAAANPASREARDARGRTPLHVATFARQRAAIRALASAGADLSALEDDRYDAVTIAAVADDEDTLRLLLSLGASARLVTSRYDGTALIAAAHLGHEGVVRQLIAAGAPLDHVNNLHWTAVIEAIVLGDGGPRHQATLRALLDAGASARLTDREGRTPLELARARGYTEMVALLERTPSR